MENKLTIPIAIIIAGIIVAGALVFTGEKSGGSLGTEQAASPTAAGALNKDVGIRPVDEKDHILGNPGALVVIVEFSDLECPYCKRFHQTMKQVVKEYGRDGRVAWVYRHFPLETLHSKARREAEATECAYELGGHIKFWEYTDRIFEITPSNNGLDLTLLPQIAADIGLDKDKFNECLNSGRVANAVQEDLEDAITSGGRGTPFSVLITRDGKTRSISGALSYETMREIIEEALAAQ